MFKQVSRVFALAMLIVASLSPMAIVAQDATPAVAPGVDAAVAWLIDQQQEDGSWLGFSGTPDAGTTIDAIVALTAANEAGIDVGDSIELAVAYLASEGVASAYAEGGVGASAKLVLALVAADADSLEIDGITPLQNVIDGQDADTGLYGFGLYDHAYALMALTATNSEIPANAIVYLQTTQAENGGFAWDGSTDEATVDSNTTAMIVQALVAAGEGESEIVSHAMDFLAETVTEAGAGYAIGSDADANSTALVAQAYIATDEDADALIAALDSFQNESGAYFWSAEDTGDNAFSTVQAIPAAVGIPMPVIPGMLELEEAA